MRTLPPWPRRLEAIQSFEQAGQATLVVGEHRVTEVRPGPFQHIFQLLKRKSVSLCDVNVVRDEGGSHVVEVTKDVSISQRFQDGEGGADDTLDQCTVIKRSSKV